MELPFNNPGEFVGLLRRRWSNLVFATVNQCHHQAPKDVIYTAVVRRNDTVVEVAAVDVRATDEVLKEHTHTTYHGFQGTATLLSPGDPLEILFNEATYLDFAWNLMEATAWFRDTTLGYQVHPPLVGDVLCGIRDSTNFQRWFTCTPAFYDLWQFVMYGKSLNHSDPEWLAAESLYNNRQVLKFVNTQLSIGHESAITDLVRLYDGDEARFARDDHERAWRPILDLLIAYPTVLVSDQWSTTPGQDVVRDILPGWAVASSDTGLQFSLLTFVMIALRRAQCHNFTN